MKIKTFTQAAEDHAVSVRTLNRWIDAGLLTIYENSEGVKFVTSEDIESLKLLHEQSKHLTLHEVSNQLHHEVLKVQSEYPQLDYSSALDSVMYGNVDLRRLWFFVSTLKGID